MPTAKRLGGTRKLSRLLLWHACVSTDLSLSPSDPLSVFSTPADRLCCGVLVSYGGFCRCPDEVRGLAEGVAASRWASTFKKVTEWHSAGESL